MHGRASTSDDPCDFSQVQALIAAGDAFLQSARQRDHEFKGLDRQFHHLHPWDESDFPFADTSGCCDANPAEAMS